MKKIVFALVAVLAITGLGLPMDTALYAQDSDATASAAEESVAAAPSTAQCPACNVEIPAGSKPVLSMLAGKSHTCATCGKAYDVAANQEVSVCPHCNAEILTCPDCGKTEAVKAS